MKKLIQIFAVAVFMMLPLFVQAQDTVSVRELNTYEGLTEYSQDALQAHPLNGVKVTYTGVIVSNPKSSGNATPTVDGNGNVTDIGRIHVFITDTAAINQGRDGMSIQIVESDWELLENFQRGDVVTFVGEMRFFNQTVQMTADEATLRGTVATNFPGLAPLLDPWEVTIDELVTANGDGTFQMDITSYQKYNGSYVRFTGATVSNISLGTRVDWALNENGSRIYVYDISLRYRNDRQSGYLPGWNYRRLPGLEGEEDGNFVPPVAGAVVNASGFLNLQGDDPDGLAAPGETLWSLSMFEDGILWTTDDVTGNPLRCEDGQLCNGETLDWPSDLEIVGLPPVFSNAAQSDSSVTSSERVTVSVDVVGVDAATITGVTVTYTSGDTTITTSISNVGDTYAVTLPRYDNFTPVSFFFEATDSEGLTGRDPISGSYGFFVQDMPINSLAIIQETADGMAGPSALAGAGEIPVEISGLIVADEESDGVVILQEAAAAWSGIFLELTNETEALVRGDSITITSAEVAEAAVASNSLTLTQLVNLTFTVNSSGNDIAPVIPTITTDTVQVLQNGGELENYEGMVVKFEDVELVDRGRFGEYTFKNTDADSADGAIFNEDIRSNSEIGAINAEFDFNHTVREGKTMNAYAVVAASFGAPKFHPRNADDIMAADGNAFTPVLDFALTAPEDSATAIVNGDLQVVWGSSEDFDGDDVTYEWVLYSEDTTTVIVTVPSDENSTAATVTLDFATLDGILADQGLQVGESASFVWNVRVSDGSDTLGVRGSYGTSGDDWEPIYRHITAERAMQVSNEGDSDAPVTFALDQNYPNPFNPSTTIKFALPATADVTLTVYNMLGQKVSTLINRKMNSGFHSVPFDASNLASGMYIYRIQAASFASTKKMMLIK